MSVDTRDIVDRARAAARPQLTGIVTGAMGLTLTVEGVSAAVGDLVEVTTGPRPLLAEVVAVGRRPLRCMPLGRLPVCGRVTRSAPRARRCWFPPGPACSAGSSTAWAARSTAGPAAGAGPAASTVDNEAPNAMKRARIDTAAAATGVRVLDTMTPSARASAWACSPAPASASRPCCR